MAQLTDAQFRVLADAATRGDTEILRGEDCTEATLRALARQHYATLQYTMVGRRKVVTSALVTRAGWLAWSDETDRRAEAARVAARAAIPAPAVTDPFAPYVNSAQARRDAFIDAAFAI